MTIEIDLDAIKRAARAATLGLWEVATIRNDGDYGGGPDCRSGFDSQVVIADGKALFDTLNSDATEVHEDYNGEDLYAWDEVGRRNMNFIAAANPAVVLELVRRLEEAERLCATVNECIVALRKIQTRCAGEALPNWENTERTGVSRSWILDRTNWALAVVDSAMGESK